MGILGVILAPASGVAAHSNQAPAVARSDAQAIQQAVTPTNTAAAQAAVVTITSSGKSRAASAGSGKFVDSAFEKQEAVGDKKKDKKGGGDSKSAVSVKA